MASSEEVNFPSIGPMEQASIEFKTIYDSLTQAGFSPSQALYLLAAQVTGSPGTPAGEAAPTPPEIHVNLCAHGALLCAPCGYIPPEWNPR